MRTAVVVISLSLTGFLTNMITGSAFVGLMNSTMGVLNLVLSLLGNTNVFDKMIGNCNINSPMMYSLLQINPPSPTFNQSTLKYNANVELGFCP